MEFTQKSRLARRLAILLLAVMLTVSTMLPSGSVWATEGASAVTEEEDIGRKLQVNPYTKADFVKNGHYISCTATKTVVGIDVSVWQGDTRNFRSPPY